MDEEVKILTDDELSSFLVLDSFKLYLCDLKKYPILSAEEENNLFVEYKNGSIKAYHKLINCNQRLIVSIAYKYKNSLKSMQLMDIIQEGNIGLMKAIEKYDVSREIKFSTYATWWIRQAIIRSFTEKNDEVRIPEYLKNNVKQYKKILEEYAKENKSGPDDYTLCKELGITKEVLEKIRTVLAQSTVSINQKIDDDGKSEIGDMIADSNASFIEDVIHKMLDKQIYVVLKEILSDLEYYIIYNRILSDDKKTLREIAINLGITYERVRQLENKILNKLKPYFVNEYEKLSKKYSRIVAEAKYSVDKIKIVPIDPRQISLYLYVKDELNYEEQNILFLQMFAKYDLTIDERAQELKLSLEELEKAEKTINDCINNKMKDIEGFRRFRKNLLKTNGKNIFNLLLKDNDVFINYNELKEKYGSLTLSEIINLYGDDYLNLSISERKLLERFFDKKEYDILPYYQIEQEVNLQKYGYKHGNNNVSLNKLYQTYLDNISEFSEDKRMYLECFIFNKREKSEFLSKYSLKDLKRLRFYLINKLEKMYYGIPNFTVLQFTREKYLKIKRLYSGKIPLEKEKILDLYYGVINGCYSISEMAEIFQVDYITMHRRLRDARDTALALYGRKKSVKLDIDSDIYVPYILNKNITLTDEAREILKLYIIDELTYAEISEYFEDKHHVKLSTTRISNIVTENIRRIDFYRFHIIEPDYDASKTLEKFYEVYGDNFNDEDKQIIYLKFVEYVPTDKISSCYGYPKELAKRIVAKFNKLYTNFLISEITVYRSDVEMELNQAKVDEILDDNERQLLALYYGIKSTYNFEGRNYSTTEISNVMGVSKNNFYHIYYKALNKIKQRKLGILKGEFAFMEKSEVEKALKDERLPISEKERDIISSLYEIDGQPYKSVEELSIIYGENSASIKRRCQRAFVSINKYLNGEIEGIINYEKDILPNLRYFSKSERILLTEKYKNGLSYNKVAKKYNVTFDRIVNIYNKLQNMLAEILNEPDFKALDFDICEKAFDSDELPFYGDVELAKKIFDDFFAMNGFGRMSSQEIIKKYNLEIKPQALVNFINLFVLSAYKFNDGFRKDKDFTNEEIRAYYEEYCDKMPKNRKKFYEKYFRRQNEKTNSTSLLVNHIILFDLIKKKYPDCFRIETASREEVIKILKDYSNSLTKRTRESLMKLFDISERNNMNGKDINHVFRLLDKLDKKLECKKGKILTLKKD